MKAVIGSNTVQVLVAFSKSNDEATKLERDCQAYLSLRERFHTLQNEQKDLLTQRSRVDRQCKEAYQTKLKSAMEQFEMNLYNNTNSPSTSTTTNNQWALFLGPQLRQAVQQVERKGKELFEMDTRLKAIQGELETNQQEQERMEVHVFHRTGNTNERSTVARPKTQTVATSTSREDMNNNNEEEVEEEDDRKPAAVENSSPAAPWHSLMLQPPISRNTTIQGSKRKKSKTPHSGRPASIKCSKMSRQSSVISPDRPTDARRSDSDDESWKMPHQHASSAVISPDRATRSPSDSDDDSPSWNSHNNSTRAPPVATSRVSLRIQQRVKASSKPNCATRSSGIVSQQEQEEAHSQGLSDDDQSSTTTQSSISSETAVDSSIDPTAAMREDTIISSSAEAVAVTHRRRGLPINSVSDETLNRLFLGRFSKISWGKCRMKAKIYSETCRNPARVRRTGRKWVRYLFFMYDCGSNALTILFFFKTAFFSRISKSTAPIARYRSKERAAMARCLADEIPLEAVAMSPEEVEAARFLVQHAVNKSFGGAEEK